MGYNTQNYKENHIIILKYSYQFILKIKFCYSNICNIKISNIITLYIYIKFPSNGEHKQYFKIHLDKTLQDFFVYNVIQKHLCFYWWQCHKYCCYNCHVLSIFIMKENIYFWVEDSNPKDEIFSYPCSRILRTP